MSRRPMHRLTLVLALAGLAAAPALAQSAHYRAELASASASDRVVTRDLVWRCGGAVCVAGKSNSRPVTDCAALASRAGALRSFAVEGRALSAEELEKCNAKAR